MDGPDDAYEGRDLVHKMISLMSKCSSRLGSFLGESCFFECLDSKQELCHTYSCLPGRFFGSDLPIPGR